MDILIPDMYQQSIYSINYTKLQEDGIKCLLFDLDNTCVPLSISEPTPKLMTLFNHLKNQGFKVIIFSNSPRQRLIPFKETLMVDCSASTAKPFKSKFLKVLNTYHYDLFEVAIIGDQLFTDILGGNRVGIKTILVNPLSSHDLLITKFMRQLEKIQLSKMHKRGIYTKGVYYE